MTSWTPPKSPYGLIQESVCSDDWKMFVCCMLLNMTTRQQLDRVFDEFFERYSTADALSKADPFDVESIIRPLGLARKRSQSLVRMSTEYLARQWTKPSDLHGLGKYADDSWRIFCVGDWQSVQPTDHMLILYIRWLAQTIGRKKRVAQ